MSPVILTGWKEISDHLRYGVRTVQRWELKGLPVKRISNSPRSPVVADSDELDAWILHRGKQLPAGAPQKLIDNFNRALELQDEVKQNRRELRRRLEVLRRELAAFRATRRGMKSGTLVAFGSLSTKRD